MSRCGAVCTLTYITIVACFDLLDPPSSPDPPSADACPALEQEAFLQRRGSMPPAAKATRIQRRDESLTAAAMASPPNTPAATADEAAPMQPAGPDQAAKPSFDPLFNVMGAITERPTEPPSAPLPPIALSAGSAPAFPAAMHRSKSKVMRRTARVTFHPFV